MSEEQKLRQSKLSQLSGPPFDVAYMQYMLKDHRNDVKQFEQAAQQLQDQTVKTWAFNTLPILKQHLDLASNIATRLGPMNVYNEETASSSK